MQSPESPTNQDLKQKIEAQQKIIDDQKRQLETINKKMVESQSQARNLSSLEKRISAGKWGIGILLGVATTALGVGQAGAIGWEMVAAGLSVCLWSAYQAREDLTTVNKIKKSGSTFSKLLTPDKLKYSGESEGRAVKTRLTPQAQIQEDKPGVLKEAEPVSTTASTLLMFKRDQSKLAQKHQPVPSQSGVSPATKK